MKLKINYKFFTSLLLLCIAVCVFTNCTKYSNNPDLRLSRDFIEAYYILTDQQRAIKMTSGQAEEKLKKEIELLQNLSDHTNAYRSRDVVFKLKAQKQKDEQVSFLYELTITIPQFGEQKYLVSIVIDQKNKKVLNFSEIK